MNDAIVIGGGVNGLVAAIYLAKAGQRVTLLEAQGHLGGFCRTAPLATGIAAPAFAHGFHALDPRVIRELRLARHGLRFAVRDMPLIGLRQDGKHVIAGRDSHLTARNLAAHSGADAEAWPRFRRDLFQSARIMRRLWWDADRNGKRPKPLARMRRSSANAWLDIKFESDALKALLLFDATDNGLSPHDAGSSLPLLWRAAQEMCGLQGAVAMTAGGPGALVTALEAAARASGVSIRVDARVRALLVNKGKACGVELDSGESLGASLVLSSLPRAATLRELVRPGDTGFSRQDNADVSKIGVVKVLLAFDRLPAFGGGETPQQGRFVVAERPESLVEAHEAARSGKLPNELVFEFVVPTASDPDLATGKQIVSALIRPVPVAPVGGWAPLKAPLAAKVVAALERFAPGTSRHVIAAKIFTPDEMEHYGAAEANARRRPSVMLSDWRERAQTPISNLWLCGADVDAMSAVSGRAGRIAARLSLHKVFGR
jgi:phytoene dehydrogenase-like protein